MEQPTQEQLLYAAAVARWGRAAQVLMAMEECGELVAALPQHFFRERLSAAKVASEVADVEIMCGQLRIILGEGLVDLAKAEKLHRLAQRLES